MPAEWEMRGEHGIPARGENELGGQKENKKKPTRGTTTRATFKGEERGNLVSDFKFFNAENRPEEEREWRKSHVKVEGTKKALTWGERVEKERRIHEDTIANETDGLVRGGSDRKKSPIR